MSSFLGNFQVLISKGFLINGIFEIQVRAGPMDEF